MGPDRKNDLRGCAEASLDIRIEKEKLKRESTEA